VIAETRDLMQGELDEARKEIEQLRRQARNSFAGQGGQPGAAHDEFLARAEKELARRKQATKRSTAASSCRVQGGETLTGPIEVGDRVWVATLQASGEVWPSTRQQRG
jgi:hypothetical protein